MIKKISIFIISFLFCLIILDFLFTFFIDCNNNLKSSYKIKKTINAEIVVLGESSVFHTFNPDSFKEKTGLSAYNLATSNANINENLVHLYLYLKNNKKPKYLLYQISPRTLDEKFLLFNSYRLMHNVGDNFIDKLIQEEDNSFNIYHHLPFIRYSFYNRYCPFYAVQGFKFWLNNEAEAYHPSGFYNIDRNWDGNIKNHLNLYGENGQINYTWSNKREKQLTRLIKYVKQQNIKLLFYKPPLYKKVSDISPNRNSMLTQIKQLSKKHEIPFWNYDSLYFSGDYTYFNAITRTNSKGNPLLMDALVIDFLKEVEIIN